MSAAPVLFPESLFKDWFCLSKSVLPKVGETSLDLFASGLSKEVDLGLGLQDSGAKLLVDLDTGLLLELSNLDFDLSVVIDTLVSLSGDKDADLLL